MSDFCVSLGMPDAQNGMYRIITAFFGPDNESQDVFGPGNPIDELLNGSGDPEMGFMGC